MVRGSSFIIHLLRRGVVSSFCNGNWAWLSVHCFFLAVFLVPPVVLSETVPGDDVVVEASAFDHSVTGFILEGQHSLLDCEGCHVGGLFDELPRQCDQCHDNVIAVGTPSTHIPVVGACDVCHSTLGFESSAMN